MVKSQKFYAINGQTVKNCCSCDYREYGSDPALYFKYWEYVVPIQQGLKSCVNELSCALAEFHLVELLMCSSSVEALVIIIHAGE